LSKVILQGYIVVPDVDLIIIESELVIHKKLTKEEIGCLQFEVSQDPNNANRYNVYEVFIDQHAFDIHQLRVKHSNWGKVTINVERHYQITDK